MLLSNTCCAQRGGSNATICEILHINLNIQRYRHHFCLCSFAILHRRTTLCLISNNQTTYYSEHFTFTKKYYLISNSKSFERQQTEWVSRTEWRWLVEGFEILQWWWGYNTVQSVESHFMFLCLLSESWWFLAWLICWSWRWMQHVPLKYQLTFDGLLYPGR